MTTATMVDVGRWAQEIDRVRERLGPRSSRSEVRARVGTYLRGLLAGVDRKNGCLLEGRGVGYVLAVACTQRLFLGGQYGCADDHADE